jgi:HlyD family secretion protein
MPTHHEPAEKSIELMAPEVDDILSKPPQGLLRWGSGWVISILVLLVAGSYYVRFPEYVEATATITTARPPVWLTARVTSRIKELHADHLSPVKQGQLIAVLENPAMESHVLAIRERLNDSTLFNPDSLLSIPGYFETAQQLGEVQPYWSAVAGRFTDYYLSVRMDNTETRISSLKRELTLLQKNKLVLERRLANQQRSNNLQRNRLERDNELLEKGVIAMETFQESEQTWLAGQEAEEDCRIAIGESTLSMSQIRQTLEDETTGKAQRQLEKRQAYLSAVKEVQSAVERWVQTYLLISPADGRLTFPTPRSLHQQVVTGDRLFAVVPTDSTHLQVILHYPTHNSGKVKAGQSVRIFLDGYPHLEYGTINATIRSTALMPGTDSNYTAIALLPAPLTTTYGKHLDLNGELTGKARIDTRTYRLIERLFNPLRYLFSSQTP